MAHPLPEWSRQIKRFRLSRNESQRELAEKLGITKKTVADWEQGRQKPSLKRYVQLVYLAGPEEAWWFLNHIGLTRDLLLTLIKEETSSHKERM